MRAGPGAAGDSERTPTAARVCTRCVRGVYASPTPCAGRNPFAPAAFCACTRSTAPSRLIPPQAPGIAPPFAVVHSVFPKRINGLLHKNLSAAAPNRLPGRLGPATTISPQRIARNEAGREGPGARADAETGRNPPVPDQPEARRSSGETVNVPRMLAARWSVGKGRWRVPRAARPGGIAGARKGNRNWAGSSARSRRVQEASGCASNGTMQGPRLSTWRLDPFLIPTGKNKKRGPKAPQPRTPLSASADANRVC
jgi:hypothetical protein